MIINVFKLKTMKQYEKEWILSLPEETKLKLLTDMLDRNEAGMALQFQMILLEAPISEGGISTEKLKAVWDKRDQNE